MYAKDIIFQEFLWKCIIIKTDFCINLFGIKYAKAVFYGCHDYTLIIRAVKAFIMVSLMFLELNARLYISVALMSAASNSL